MSKKLLSKNNEWDLDNVQAGWTAIEKIVKEKYGLEYYKVRFEIITYEHMLDIYSSYALPNLYNHWSFGRSFVKSYHNYKNKNSELAYEVAINTDPCVVYLMANNSFTLQMLVMAHAGIGHNHFFANNVTFKEHTAASKILSVLSEGRKYINDCEEKYGIDEVESLIDVCHALFHYSIDRYKKPYKSRRDAVDKKKQRRKDEETSHNPLLDVLDKPKPLVRKDYIQEENILWLLEKYSPSLKEWERRVIRTVRKVNQYLYPQMLTKTMNEGWASFWHWTLMHDLYEAGYVSEASMIEFYACHSSVLYQPDYGAHFNPYKLGFSIWMDLRRICEKPTEEDIELYPELANTDWVKSLCNIMETYKDDSFLRQYLTPTVIRDLKLFSIEDIESKNNMYIRSIHDNDDHEHLRRVMSKQYEFMTDVPDIKVTDFSTGKRRRLELTHFEHDEKRIDEKTAKQVLQYMKRLWPYEINFIVRDSQGEIETVVDENWNLVDYGPKI